MMDGQPKRLVLKVDSREQEPLKFKDGVFDEIVVEGLPVGDYWAELDGKELPLCFERKALGDLFGTMTAGYRRFKKELSRAKEFGLRIVLVIEGSMREVEAGYRYSQFPGRAMLKKLAMLYVRYDLEYHFFNDRREMARFIEEVFDACRRNYGRTETKTEERPKLLAGGSRKDIEG
jgi:ERCC4-type nuclease